MNKTSRILLIPAILLALSCQLVSGLGTGVRGSGNVVSESRPVMGFDRVSVCCGIELYLTQDGRESVEIEADDNILPQIETTVVNNELIIRYKNQLGGMAFKPSSPVKARVSAIELRGVDLSGGGWMDAGQLVSDDFSLNLSGGSQAKVAGVEAGQLDIQMSGGGHLSISEASSTRAAADLSGGAQLEIASLTGQDFELRSSGGGWIQVQGSVATQRASLSGGTQYQAGELESQAATIGMSGGGESTVWVTDELNVDLSGGAQVSYYGSPSVNSNLSGGGQLQPLGEK